MKFATHILCAFATFQFTGLVWAEEPFETILANPASQISEVERESLASILTNPASLTSQLEEEPISLIMPATFAGGPMIPCACDGGCCECGSSCCDGSSCMADGCCGKGVEGCCGDAVCGPLWTASAGLAILNRSQPVPSVIAAPLAGLGLRATDFSIGTTVGADLLLSRRITRKGSLEARYLGALEWDPRAEFTGLTDIDLGGIDLNGITAIGGGYNSTLHSSEFNYRHQQTERFSWLVGFRWIELQDTVDFGVVTGLGALSLAWNTNNHLYGGQVGADYLFWQSARRPLSVKGSGKFGVFGNVADNDFSQFVGPVEVASGGGFGSDTSFVTDLGVWVSYQISEHWSARAGGQFLYIDSVAIATDQIAASLVQDTPNVFDSSGYVYYTGGLVSLDYVW